ncbi:MAG: dTMP kinase [Candidatus Pacebacteria bacterium]|nr:dTMP kinase [Candidatus Paceibacterota bacterium]
MKKGKFIVVEGGDGAGKSSQLKRLKEELGEAVVITREPGGSQYAEEIRNLILKSPHAKQADAKTLFALFWAARADHLKNTVLPALERGITIISDRFDSSTFAYQIYGQEAKELEKFFWTIRDFYLGEIRPDLYIYLDVDIETGLRRKAGQGEDENNHFDAKKLDFHKRMREGFMQFLTRVPHVIIDANQSVESVRKNLKKALSLSL